jgi:hypothetical protein
MVISRRLDVTGLAVYRPWTVLSTKALASALRIDPITLAMRVYRGVGPKPVPRWLKGHVVGYMTSSALRWLGDPRSEVDIFREDLISNGLTDLTANDLPDDDAVRLYSHVAVVANPNVAIVGATFTPKGWKEYLRSIRGDA